jgi:hypothetical protein
MQIAAALTSVSWATLPISEILSTCGASALLFQNTKDIIRSRADRRDCCCDEMSRIRVVFLPLWCRVSKDRPSWRTFRWLCFRDASGHPQSRAVPEPYRSKASSWNKQTFQLLHNAVNKILQRNKKVRGYFFSDLLAALQNLSIRKRLKL